MNKNFIINICFAMMLFVGCDPILKLNYSVINATSEPIKIKISVSDSIRYDSFLESIDSNITLNPNDTAILYDKGRIGFAGEEYAYDHRKHAAKIMVYNMNDSLMYDYTVSDSMWDYEFRRTKKYPRIIEYFFTIKDKP